MHCQIPNKHTPYTGITGNHPPMSLKHLLVATAMISVSRQYPDQAQHRHCDVINTRATPPADLLTLKNGSPVAAASPCCGSFGAQRAVQLSIPQTQGALQSRRRECEIRRSWVSLTADPVHRERTDRFRYQLCVIIAVSTVMSTSYTLTFTILGQVCTVLSGVELQSTQVLDSVVATGQQRMSTSCVQFATLVPMLVTTERPAVNHGTENINVKILVFILKPLQHKGFITSQLFVVLGKSVLS